MAAVESDRIGTLVAKPVLHHPTGLAKAAAAVDHGSVDAIAEKTLHRNDEIDERCAEIDRDPRGLRRSLVMWPPLDPWADADAFKRIVETFLPNGINEFVVMWPGDDRRALIEHAAEAMTVLRAA